MPNICMLKSIELGVWFFLREVRPFELKIYCILCYRMTYPCSYKLNPDDTILLPIGSHALRYCKTNFTKEYSGFLHGRGCMLGLW